MSELVKAIASGALFDDSKDPTTECLKRVSKAINYHLKLDTANNPENAGKLVKYCMNTMLVDTCSEVVRLYNTPKEIEAIPKEYITECDFNQCQIISRHTRDRHKDEINQDPEVLFWIDLLDSMHCYLTHSFDMGLRVRPKDIESDDKKDEDEESPFMDHVWSLITTVVHHKRNTLEAACDMHRFQSNGKFDLNVNENNKCQEDTSFMDELYDQLLTQKLTESIWNQIQNEEEYDTDAVLQDVFYLNGSPKHSNLFALLDQDEAKWKKIYNLCDYGMLCYLNILISA